MKARERLRQAYASNTELSHEEEFVNIPRQGLRELAERLTIMAEQIENERLLDAWHAADHLEDYVDRWFARNQDTRRTGGGR